MNHSAFVYWTHDKAFTLGQMLALFLLIGICGAIFWGTAHSIATKETHAVRENCKITSIDIVGVGEAAEEKPSVIVNASCSFGQVTQEWDSANTVLAFAITKPQEIACYEKKYAHKMVKGCDKPK